MYVEEYGAFLVFGGESNQEAGTMEGLVTGQVFERIDIYLVGSNTWVLS